MKAQSVYDLFYAYAQQVSAKECLENLVACKGVSFTAKQMVQRHILKLNANIKELKNCVPPADQQILEKEMLNLEVSLQAQSIQNMVAELPPAKRDEVERYIQLQYNIYKQQSA